MNLRDLQYLCAVADLQHFGKAAEACHVSQPTLSMQLKKLETYLGVALFERINKRVLITPAGKEIVNSARRILVETQNIREVARTLQDPYAGKFFLGVFPTLAPYYLPQIMPGIYQKLPQLEILIIEEKTEILIEKLKSGKLDAALLALPVPDEELTSTQLFEDVFTVAVSQRHAWAKRKSLSLSDIQKERLMLLEEGHCLREQALEVCNRAGTLEYSEFRATSLETLRCMVAAGIGATLMPQIAQKNQDGLVYIPIQPNPPSRTIGLVWRKSSIKKLCIDELTRLFRSVKFTPTF